MPAALQPRAPLHHSEIALLAERRWLAARCLDAPRESPHRDRRAMSKLERRNYPHLAQPVGPYVQAVKHDGLLFLSGLTALGSAAQSRGIKEQVAAICEAIANAARHERTDLSSLVKVTLFVTSLQFASELSAAWSEHFSGCSAMSSLMQVGKLVSPDVLVEAQAVLALR
jgi:2-iminobutanoate/2-iminopropanoate deaminase